MHLENGSLLQGGRYKITRLISSGSMGRVYEGLHTAMGTKIAVKEFAAESLKSTEAETQLRQKFMQDAKMVFQMQHPNIARVLDVFEENGTPCFVMDFIEGQTLQQIVEERGGITDVEAVDYLGQISQALGYIHKGGMCHLNLNPSNILISEDCQVKVIDFGTTKYFNHQGENICTALGVDDEHFCATELKALDFERITPASDVYSLGALLLYALTGKVPPTADELANGQQTIDELTNELAPEMATAIKMAMNPKRNLRPQTVDSFMTIINNGSPAVSSASFAGVPKFQPVQPSAAASSTSATTPTPAPAKKEQPKVEEKPAPKPQPKPEPKPEPQQTDSDDQLRDELLRAISSGREAEEAYEEYDDPGFVKKNLLMIVVASVAFLLIVGCGYIFYSLSAKEKSEAPKTDDTELAADTIKNDSTAKAAEPTIEQVVRMEYKNEQGVLTGYYTGQTVNGKLEGEGKFEFVAGGYAKGTFKNDRIVNGTAYTPDGYYFNGTFQNGEPYTGTWHEANGTQVSKMVNGKEL